MRAVFAELAVGVEDLIDHVWLCLGGDIGAQRSNVVLLAVGGVHIVPEVFYDLIDILVTLIFRAEPQLGVVNIHRVVGFRNESDGGIEVIAVKPQILVFSAQDGEGVVGRGLVFAGVARCDIGIGNIYAVDLDLGSAADADCAVLDVEVAAAIDLGVNAAVGNANSNTEILLLPFPVLQRYGDDVGGCQARGELGRVGVEVLQVLVLSSWDRPNEVVLEKEGLIDSAADRQVDGCSVVLFQKGGNKVSRDFLFICDAGAAGVLVVAGILVVAFGGHVSRLIAGLVAALNGCSGRLIAAGGFRLLCRFFAASDKDCCDTQDGQHDTDDFLHLFFPPIEDVYWLPGLFQDSLYCKRVTIGVTRFLRHENDRGLL